MWNINQGDHDKWHQFYIILKGKGIMQIGEEKIPVAAPSVIMIPFNTLHALEVEKNEEVEYVYVNQFLKDPA
jgi:mannose-6-phosphate isomerase-like protein (cupin superfamily)